MASFTESVPPNSPIVEVCVCGLRVWGTVGYKINARSPPTNLLYPLLEKATGGDQPFRGTICQGRRIESDNSVTDTAGLWIIRARVLMRHWAQQYFLLLLNLLEYLTIRKEIQSNLFPERAESITRGRETLNPDDYLLLGLGLGEEIWTMNLLKPSIRRRTNQWTCAQPISLSVCSWQISL